MDILFQTRGGSLGPVILGKDFIIEDRPRLTAVIPIKLISYVGYPKQWNDNASVQVFAGGQEHNLYMASDEAKPFVDLLLGAIASK